MNESRRFQTDEDKRDSDPIQVVKIENNDILQILSQSTCSCQLQNNILLFAKKGQMTAVSIDKDKINVLNQTTQSIGVMDQMYYNSQFRLLLCLMGNKLETFHIDTQKKAPNEFFRRVNIKQQIKNNGPFECFSVYYSSKKKDTLFIAAVDNKKKSSITLIQSKTDGIFYNETKVWTAEEKVVGCCFVNNHLVLIFPAKIQIISFFGEAKIVNEKMINPFKGKPRFMSLETNQILVQTGGCVYLVDDSNITLVPTDYEVITITKMSPFIFFMLEFAHNKFYVSYRLEPIDIRTPASTEFRRPEYYKESYMHENQPVFINKATKSLIYFTPNPKWYETAIQNGHYKSGIDFIRSLGDNSDATSEQYKKAAYILGVIERMIDFYSKEENRTVATINSILDDFKMADMSAKNILVFVVQFLFNDFITDLYELFDDWFTIKVDEWEKDLKKSFPDKLINNLNELMKVLNETREQAQRDHMFKVKNNSIPMKHHFNDGNHSIKDIVFSIITLLMTLKSQTIKDDDNGDKYSTEIKNEKELFYTSLVVIVYYQSPESKDMFELLKNTNYLKTPVIMKLFKSDKLINKKLLIEYYISKNHIDMIFQLKDISYLDKRTALMRLLKKKENVDNNKIYEKIKELVEDKIVSNGGNAFIESNNFKLKDELYLIFGRDSPVKSIEEICQKIEDWKFNKTTLKITNDLEMMELNTRISCLYCEICLFNMIKRKGNEAEIKRLAHIYVRKYLNHIVHASKLNLDLTEEYFQNFIEIIEKYPEFKHEVSNVDISPFYYKIKTIIEMKSENDILPILLKICKQLKRNEEKVEEIYSEGFNEMLQFMIELYNQKAFNQSVTNETIFPLLYSQHVQKILRENYQRLKSVNNILAEITFDIFSSENPKKEYLKIHEALVTENAPCAIIRYIWEIAHPLELPIPGDDEGIKNRLTEMKGKDERQSMLEGIISYLEKKQKNEGVLLIDCYLEYLKITTNDRFNVTNKLMEQMGNNAHLQNYISKDYDDLPWRLKCRIQHTKCKFKGLLEHFDQMKKEYIDLKLKNKAQYFVEETFKELDEFLTQFDSSFKFNYTSGSIAKMIRLIKQNYRPFNKIHPKHIGAETIMYCVCQMNLNTNTSCLLALLIHLLLEKNVYYSNNTVVPFNQSMITQTSLTQMNEINYMNMSDDMMMKQSLNEDTKQPRILFMNPFPIQFALELFSRFYPIIPLKFTDNEMKWLGVNDESNELKIELTDGLFAKMLNNVENFNELKNLLPSIYSCARNYFYMQMYLGAARTLTASETKRYEVIDRRTMCCKCHHPIKPKDSFVVIKGQYAHEFCTD